MRSRILAAILLLVAVAATPYAQQGPDPTQLPVRRVVLYKSGVGYFEHRGSITGSADVAIQFTSGQLNDVLKSLTALDLDNGRIASIGYNSIAPIEQRLDALRLPLGAKPDLLQFYNALRGARVEVRAGGTSVTGRLLGIERKMPRGEGVEPTDVLTVIATDGTVRSVTLGPTVTVRIAEQDLRDEIGRYLAVIASGRNQDIRRMTLAATGEGARRLLISYVSEVPVWKSTYRLVLSETGEKAVLQGWAIVDNTVGEDWTDVELSLVAGAPQSFIQQISQPYYARRPVVPLPQTLLMSPQTHSATLQASSGTLRGSVRDNAGGVLPGVTVQLADSTGRVVAQTVTNGSGEYELNAAPGSYSLRMALSGFQTASRNVAVRGGAPEVANGSMSVAGISEVITVAGESAALDQVSSLHAGGGRGGVPGGIFGGVVGGLPEAPAANPVAVRQAAQSPPVATSQELGELFEYRLTQPVTIRTNQSALVPILTAPVSAERVSLWNRTPGTGRPLRALWLTNATGMTLDGGTLSVIEANAFAGEGLVEPLKPGEKRFISYGSDLGVLVDARLDNSSGRYTRLVARDGVVVAEQEDRNRWVYRVRNEDGGARRVVVEHPVREGWTLSSDPAPVEKTATSARFTLPVAPRSEATLAVSERRVGESRFNIDQIDDRLIVSFGHHGVSVEALRRALQPVTDARAQVAELDRRLNSLTTQVTAIASDQQRVRENIKALGDSREQRALIERYTRELNAQEDRLEQLQEQIAQTAGERDARRAALAQLIRQLSFEVIGD